MSAEDEVRKLLAESDASIAREAREQAEALDAPKRAMLSPPRDETSLETIRRLEAEREAVLNPPLEDAVERMRRVVEDITLPPQTLTTLRDFSTTLRSASADLATAVDWRLDFAKDLADKFDGLSWPEPTRLFKETFLQFAAEPWKFSEALEPWPIPSTGWGDAFASMRDLALEYQLPAAVGDSVTHWLQTLDPSTLDDHPVAAIDQLTSRLGEQVVADWTADAEAAEGNTRAFLTDLDRRLLTWLMLFLALLALYQGNLRDDAIEGIAGALQAMSETLNGPAQPARVIGRAHLRSEPHGAATVVGWLEEGQVVRILREQGGWLFLERVTIGGEAEHGWSIGTEFELIVP